MSYLSAVQIERGAEAGTKRHRVGIVDQFRLDHIKSGTAVSCREGDGVHELTGAGDVEVLAGSRCATLAKQGKGRASWRQLPKTMKYSAEGLG